MAHPVLCKGMQSMAAAMSINPPTYLTQCAEPMHPIGTLCLYYRHKDDKFSSH